MGVYVAGVCCGSSSLHIHVQRYRLKPNSPPVRMCGEYTTRQRPGQSWLDERPHKGMFSGVL
eukprot:1929796-Amphidinium_carterae.2